MSHRIRSPYWTRGSVPALDARSPGSLPARTAPGRAQRTRSLGRHPALLVLIALATTLVVEGWAIRRARACGGHEIDYGPDKVVTEKHNGRSEVHLNFRRKSYNFSGGNLNFSEVRVYTRDARLAAWLDTHGMSDAMWASLKKVGAQVTCAVLYEGPQVVKLERRLADAVLKAYRKATRRTAPRPDVMLVSVVLEDSEPVCSPKAP